MGQPVARGSLVRSTADLQESPSFEIVEEPIVFQRYFTLYNRKIRFPAVNNQESKVHEFDVIGHPKLLFTFTVVFPFHPYKDGRKGGEVTVLREYCQGVGCIMYTLPTGGLEPAKHANVEECANSELSEEAVLKGGKMVALTPPGHPGISEVKWCMNRFIPFLCIDPEADEEPGPRDTEEYIEVYRVGIPELKEIVKSGDMTLPSMTTCFLALDRLAELEML